MTGKQTGGAAEESAAPRNPRWADRNLPTAIAVAGLLYLWIVTSLLFWQWGFIIFLMVCIVFGTYELVTAFNRVGLNAAFSPIAIGGPLTLLATHIAAHMADQTVGVTALVIGLALMVVLTVIMRLRGPVKGFIGDVAAGVFIIGYLPLLLSTLTLLLAQPQGNLRVVLFFLLVPCADTGAYGVGSLIGRHKMAPHISPGKTWEGFVGAIVITALVGALLAHLMIGAQWWVGAVIGMLLAVTGATGDLVESMIKREAGIKDMGIIVPGHGGAMDRLDSLLLSAPIAWISMLVLV